MKRVTTATVIAIVALVLVWDAVEFAGGYNVFPLGVGFFPASFFLFALTAAATCVAAIVICVALFRRHWRNAVILAAAVFGCWVLSPWFAARSAFLFGLAARFRQPAVRTEIQQVAQRCLSLMPSGGHVFAPRKIMGPRPGEAEQSKEVWDAISSYRFVHLKGDTCVISVRPPEVSFEWGGALPGHWGISVGGSRDDPPRGYYMQTIRFSDGMILFRGQ